MEERQAPQMYYKGGKPQGYRVGIGINGAYGICPFCGKVYTEEDIKNGSINFEHIYPRFAIKDAIKLVNRGDDKNKKSPEIEASVKVAAHKECNSKGKELEDTIKKLVGSFNKDGQLTPEQAENVSQYLKKTSVFLCYLINWKHFPVGFSYEKEKANTTKEWVIICFSENYPNTLVYNDENDFLVSCNGLCFCYKKLDDVDFATEFKYWKDFAQLTIGHLGNSLFYVPGMKGLQIKKYIFDKPRPWKLNPGAALLFLLFAPKTWNHSLGNLPKFEFFIPDQENPSLRNRLEYGGKYREDIDDDIIFRQRGELYIYENGHKCKLSRAKPRSTYWLVNLGLTKLPDLSDFVVESFNCSGNKLTTLEGAPKKVTDFFSCGGNPLKSLKGAPEIVGGDFDFDVSNLNNLDYLPKANSYEVVDAVQEFDSADELRAWFAKYKKERDGKKRIATGLRAGAARVAAAGAVQKTKRKTKPDNQKKK